jgi:site-specific recombinase XerD
MKLSKCIRQFFITYLPRIRNVSEETIKSYRDTIKIFLPFAARYHSIKIESLQIEHLTFELILDFLDYLEDSRNNITRTRNHRLAVLKALAKMIRLMYPEHKETAERILYLPQKRAQKNLIEFFYNKEVLEIFKSVDLRKKEGFRDYTLLNLLYDSGARASEIGTLNLDYFDVENKTLTILGKGNRFRRIELWHKTVILLKSYIKEYRNKPKPLYMNRLFINQRGEELTRHGINCICKKYIYRTLSKKRLRNINPVHSFRHSCAINMLRNGYSVIDIKIHLGHENIQSTMTYLKLDISRKKEIQENFIKHTQSVFTEDSELDKLLDWDNKEDILSWLDSL